MSSLHCYLRSIVLCLLFRGWNPDGVVFLILWWRIFRSCLGSPRYFKSKDVLHIRIVLFVSKWSWVSRWSQNKACSMPYPCFSAVEWEDLKDFALSVTIHRVWILTQACIWRIWQHIRLLVDYWTEPFQKLFWRFTVCQDEP